MEKNILIKSTQFDLLEFMIKTKIQIMQTTKPCKNIIWLEFFKKQNKTHNEHKQVQNPNMAKKKTLTNN
jgi:hypothetical protein